ncbi:ABC transporter ATP-binding protein [Halanaerobium sp. Z-7514]|uniref:ABC transporter ATP-binding protein n=1 Tax=Halanaerobium polyolivorans TaxID=2886943 RepID=A0AAW4X019_9FIRM|nr:ABC transporter ATP-binding protein [Halanaerobium polyolivorans]MCC3144496.1 ABC transporter ATP-binding protein [Halanaerobium polyolivorans]RQD69836.1 MAG: ABC transporter ATP-binding protein [Halanaerobium sp. MSAO_Bac5]
MTKLLEVKDLHLKIEDAEILNGLNFSLEKGEVFALIGPNGCGKSTLAYTLMGINKYYPDQGELLLNGEEIKDLPINERAKKGITLAWQEPARYQGVTVREFLSLGLKAKKEEVTEEKLRDALQKVAIRPETYLDRFVDKSLSGGERKRIELAALILMHPELIILDEPDSGVDIVALNNIADMINYFKESQSGILLITHSQEMLKYADRAALLCDGEIIRQGKPEAISEYFKSFCGPCTKAEECETEVAS